MFKAREKRKERMEVGIREQVLSSTFVLTGFQTLGLRFPSTTEGCWVHWWLPSPLGLIFQALWNPKDWPEDAWKYNSISMYQPLIYPEVQSLRLFSSQKHHPCPSPFSSHWETTFYSANWSLLASLALRAVLAISQPNTRGQQNQHNSNSGQQFSFSKAKTLIGPYGLVQIPWW